jgi:hypothetical protein
VSDLSPLAKQLVRAGRAASRPTTADRERVLHSLQEHLTNAPGLLAAKTGFGSSSLVWPGIGIGVALCGVVAAILLLNEPVKAPSSSVPLTARSAVVAAAPPSINSEAAPDVDAPAPEPSAKLDNTARRSTARSSDRLAEEVAILSRAEADFRRGQPAFALRALDEHRSKFPNGMLSVERRAAQVRALCAMGRAREATAELARLSRIAGGSALERRAREACGALVTN